MAEIIQKAPSRLELIYSLDPNYAQELVELFSEIPELEKFASIMPLQRFPRLPRFPSVREALIYYVVQSSISADAGAKNYQYYLNGEYNKIHPPRTKDLFDRTLALDFNKLTTSASIDTIQCSGIGENAKMFVKISVFGEDHFLHSERRVLSGMSIVYGRKLTAKNAKDLSANYLHKYLAYSAFLQVSYYGKKL